MRYSAFLDTEKSNGICRPFSLDFKVFKSDATDDFYTCHPVKDKQRKSFREREEIDALYFESKKTAGKMPNKSFDEKMAIIKDILSANIKERRKALPEQRKEYDTMIERLDEYMNDRTGIEKFNSFQRAKRFFRKFAMNKQKFNYAFTVTWDGSLFNTEEEWQKSLLKYFGNICDRDSVKIMGAFEYGEENERIHFHGVGYFPDEYINNGLYQAEHYSKKLHRRVKYIEFNKMRKRFGENEFDSLKCKSKQELKSVLNYITKYVIKNNGRTYYSRGLPDNVVTPIDPKYCFYEFCDGVVKYYLAEDFSFEKNRFFRELERLKEVPEEELPFDTVGCQT